jgi:hypothetical protein
VLPAEAPRERRLVRLAAGALSALVLLAAGCGDDEDEPADAQSPETTELEVTLDPDGDGEQAPLEATFSCGEGRDAAEAACAALGQLPENPGAPTPPGTACTEIFGGPDVLKVSGTLRGEPIDAEMTRANGCEIERFERFMPLIAELFPDYEPGSAISG